MSDKYEEAKKICIESGKASVSQLQRKLETGYNESRRYMDRMIEDGIVVATDKGVPFYVMAINKEDIGINHNEE